VPVSLKGLQIRAQDTDRTVNRHDKGGFMNRDTVANDLFSCLRTGQSIGRHDKDGARRDTGQYCRKSKRARQRGRLPQYMK
jgi:hypothetical protein